MFAIKQQEQAAYQALISNPLRLKELQERNGVKASKRSEKQARKEAKAERKRLKLLAREPESSTERVRGRNLSRSRSRSPRYGTSRSPQRGKYRRRSASPRPHRIDDRRYISRTPPSDYEKNRRRERHNERSRSPARSIEGRTHKLHPQTSSANLPPRNEDDRVARLAAMTVSAHDLELERRQRLEAMLEKEKEELERENRERLRLSKTGVGGFLEGERRRVYAGGMEGGLAERIRRGRATLVGVD